MSPRWTKAQWARFYWAWRVGLLVDENTHCWIVLSYHALRNGRTFVRLTK